MRYQPADIEKKWQAYWAENKIYQTPNPGDADFDASKPKYYVLDMFPYPSGVGLHVGHPLGYIATDIMARYKKMRGFNVLHPMGYDAFGLPAEQFAVEHGVHPRETTENNIANMTRQLKLLGLGYDWDRSLATTDVGYYKWTQWIFLQLFNSWFNPKTQKAEPIGELIHALNSGHLLIGLDGELHDSRGVEEDMDAIVGTPVGFQKWHELSENERWDFIDNHRLAFLAEVDVNWCPQLGTVLANEEVDNEGRSERGNFPVFKRPLKQWMLRITSYAERLIDDLDMVDWPEAIKLLQRNWIGKSTGAEVHFEVDSDEEEAERITVFTTRPDTLFGATYMVLAPEHPLVLEITTPEQASSVKSYQAEAASKSEADRAGDEREGKGADKNKTGVFTGAYAINPVNGQKVPIWIADYVMMGYGTGAIMAVPAHDTRDHAFATKYDIDIIEVVKADGDHDLKKEAWTGDGELINSANDEISINGLPVAEAKAKITAWLEAKALGSAQVQYKLRDWLFSRQRYWGEPFPILHELDQDGNPNGRIRDVPIDLLPVEHPHMDDFRPSPSDDPDAEPKPPLARAKDDWLYVELDGKLYKREVNTMPQWAGSCWYYLRYLDNTNEDRFVGEAAENYWMVSEKKPGPDGEKRFHSGGVDLYVGGVEHAVLHLLYARFWHKVLFDLNHVSTPEPFGKLFNQGYIQGYYYEKENGTRVPAVEVVNAEGKPAGEVQGIKGQTFKFEGEAVIEKYGKMGKSLKNAVSPDEICEQYGADTLRLYEMYMGPLDASKPWSTQDIVGVNRFLNRLWRNLISEEGELTIDDADADGDLKKLLHRTIANVTENMEGMHFNVAIAELIKLNNELVKLDKTPKDVAEAIAIMLSPLAPHFSEEMWSRLGHRTSSTLADWPTFDPALLVDDEIEIPVQVNGKVRAKITISRDADKDTVEQLARDCDDEKLKAALEGVTIRKVIVIPGKMVNIVAK